MIQHLKTEQRHQFRRFRLAWHFTLFRLAHSRYRSPFSYSHPHYRLNKLFSLR
jgi:hypothetical protein